MKTVNEFVKIISHWISSSITSPPADRTLLLIVEKSRKFDSSPRIYPFEPSEVQRWDRIKRDKVKINSNQFQCYARVHLSAFFSTNHDKCKKFNSPNRQEMWNVCDFLPHREAQVFSQKGKEEWIVKITQHFQCDFDECDRFAWTCKISSAAKKNHESVKFLPC